MKQVKWSVRDHRLEELSKEDCIEYIGNKIFDLRENFQLELDDNARSKVFHAIARFVNEIIEDERMPELKENALEVYNFIYGEKLDLDILDVKMLQLAQACLDVRMQIGKKRFHKVMLQLAKHSDELAELIDFSKIM